MAKVKLTYLGYFSPTNFFHFQTCRHNLTLVGMATFGEPQGPGPTAGQAGADEVGVPLDKVEGVTYMGLTMGNGTRELFYYVFALKNTKLINFAGYNQTSFNMTSFVEAFGLETYSTKYTYVYGKGKIICTTI